MTLQEALALARTHHAAGRLEQAASVYTQILGAMPPQAAEMFVAQAGYGQVLQALGRTDEAIACYRRALELRPDFVDIRSVMGALLVLRGRHAEAEPELRRVLELRPDMPGAHGNLGIALHGLGRHAESESCLRRALQAQPDSPGLLNHLGVVLNALGRQAEAAPLFRRALELQPDFLAAHNNLGRALLNLAQHAEAEQALRVAVQRYPDHAVLQGNLAIALLNQGKHAQAGEAVRHGLQKFPEAIEAQSGLLYALMCDASCTPDRYLAAARQYGKAVQRIARPFTAWKCALPGSSVQPLRVGLVSGDMRTHPVGYFLENLLQHIDPRRLEVIAYTTRSGGDALTERLRRCVAAWHDISAPGDADAARRIHEDGIHVLVDLAGHTTHNRLPLFAWKPAPLQVAWLGYFASTGVAAIDYVLVDAVSVHADEQAQFTERPWYLPETRLCFTPPTDDEAPAVAALPAAARGQVTFGSFQNMVKLGDPVLDLWARVLAAVPGSRLRLQNAEMGVASARDALLPRLAARGVAADRVELAGPAPRMEYLAAHAGVDIVLDTFPYPGGTTTCEALWMGVPTLTLRGNSLLSRQGASLLTAAGLTEWVAEDADDYVARAARLAGDVAALSRLRAGLRARVRASPLCDGARFARHFEDAFYGMWQAAAATGKQEGR